jgi:hypothetical protein
MSALRSALLAILYDGELVREPYINLILSLLSSEFDVIKTYTFFDGNIKREGITYIIGSQEIYWLKEANSRPAMLVIRSQLLRENILDLLAVHPLYAKWFDHTS